MAYKRDPIKIMPGSIDLRPPVDQIGASDAMALIGWWPGTTGKLIQNSGAATISNKAAGVALDSLLQANGAYYYGGAGKLSAVGRDGGSPWYFDSGYDGQPLGMCSFQGRAWIMNQARQMWDDGSVTAPWTTETGAGGTVFDLGGGSLNPAGPYDYYFTWVDAHGNEGNPSAAFPFHTTSSNPQCQATRGTPATAAVTSWNLYRKGPGTALIYLINPTPIPLATTQYFDFGDVAHAQDDQSLLDLNIPLEKNHDPAPPCMVLCQQTYNGRLVAANSAAHPNRVFYTPALEPGFFPGSAAEDTGNWVDVGTDSSDPVLAIGARPGMLIFYRRRSIWRLLGDFQDSNAVVEIVVPDLGIVGPRALVSTSIADYFAGDQGVYRFNNDWAAKISQKIEPLFLYGSTPLVPESPYFSGLNTAAAATMALGLVNGRLWLSYAGYASATNSQTFLYHLESAAWVQTGGSGFGPSGFGAFLNTGPGAEFTAVDSSGHVYHLETGLNVDGTPSSLIFQSGFQDCGLPDHVKTWGELAFPASTQSDQTITPFVVTDKGAAGSVSVSLDPVPVSFNGRYHAPLVYPITWPTVPLRGEPIRSLNLSVGLTGLGSAIQPGTSIDGPMELSYYLEARKGILFDTGPTNHGYPLAKTLDQVEFEIDASGGVYTVEIYSDIPGGVLAQRENFGQPPTSGREVVRLILSPPADGRLFRYVVASAFPLQVFSFRVRILPIGVYLDGTIGDFLVTRPISVGA